MRARTLGLLAMLGTTLPVGLVVMAHGADSSEPAAEPTARHSATTRALSALRAWDTRRARAWAAADPQALARLYAPTSRTGRRDVADLRCWMARGLRVVGLRQQVEAARVVQATARVVVVVVTDRTVDGLAVGRGRRTAVPASAWAAHRIRLVRTDGRWRVAEAWRQPAR